MKGVLLVIVACLIWAVDALIRYPLLEQGLSATRIVFSEHILLVALFSAVLWKNFGKIGEMKVSHLFYFFMIGGVGSAFATLSFTKAFTLINPSLVILLQKFQPLVAIVMARIFIGEKLSFKFLVWAFVCLIGGVLISFKDVCPIFRNGFSLEDFLTAKAVVGYVLTLIAVVGWGGATVFGKLLSIEGYRSREIMGGRFLFGLICILPFVFINKISFDLNSVIWGKIGLMVLLSGVIAMFIYYRGLKLISAKACTLAEMFFPFGAIAVNWVFLGASLNIVQIIGGAILLFGSTVIQLKRY